MKIKSNIHIYISVIMCLVSVSVFSVYSGSELKPEKDSEELPFPIPLVKQPFGGKLIILLDQAIDLHKREVGVPLEKYVLIIAEDDEDYYILFSDAERVPGAVGSRINVPEYQVTGNKETFEITSHSRLK